MDDISTWDDSLTYGSEKNLTMWYLVDRDYQVLDHHPLRTNVEHTREVTQKCIDAGEETPHLRLRQDHVPTHEILLPLAILPGPPNPTNSGRFFSGMCEVDLLVAARRLIEYWAPDYYHGGEEVEESDQENMERLTKVIGSLDRRLTEYRRNGFYWK